MQWWLFPYKCTCLSYFPTPANRWRSNETFQLNMNCKGSPQHLVFKTDLYHNLPWVFDNYLVQWIEIWGKSHVRINSRRNVNMMTAITGQKVGIVDKPGLSSMALQCSPTMIRWNHQSEWNIHIPKKINICDQSELIDTFLTNHSRRSTADRLEQQLTIKEGCQQLLNIQ